MSSRWLGARWLDGEWLDANFNRIDDPGLPPPSLNEIGECEVPGYPSWDSREIKVQVSECGRSDGCGFVESLNLWYCPPGDRGERQGWYKKRKWIGPVAPSRLPRAVLPPSSDQMAGCPKISSNQGHRLPDKSPKQASVEVVQVDDTLRTTICNDDGCGLVPTLELWYCPPGNPQLPAGWYTMADAAGSDAAPELKAVDSDELPPPPSEMIKCARPETETPGPFDASLQVSECDDGCGLVDSVGKWFCTGFYLRPQIWYRKGGESKWIVERGYSNRLPPPPEQMAKCVDASLQISKCDTSSCGRVKDTDIWYCPPTSAREPGTWRTSSGGKLSNGPFKLPPSPANMAKCFGAFDVPHPWTPTNCNATCGHLEQFARAQFCRAANGGREKERWNFGGITYQSLAEAMKPSADAMAKCHLSATAGAPNAPGTHSKPLEVSGCVPGCGRVRGFINMWYCPFLAGKHKDGWFDAKAGLWGVKNGLDATKPDGWRNRFETQQMRPANDVVDRCFDREKREHGKM